MRGLFLTLIQAVAHVSCAGSTLILDDEYLFDDAGMSGAEASLRFFSPRSMSATRMNPHQAAILSSSANSRRGNGDSDDHKRPLLMAYYPDWAGDEFPPEKIDFERFDWIDFAFAIPDQNFNLSWDDPDEGPALLRRLADSAHANNKKVKLSVGGWTGSKYFSSAVATPENRQIFAQNIVLVYRVYNLDGIDIDWEYPGELGDKGNQVNAKDSENLLLFLQLLRILLPATAKISAAAVSAPFIDSRGHPMKDMTEFAKVLDWVLLMNYDVWSSSQEPGPNAPMYDACKNSSQPAAYGYISNSRASRLRTRDVSQIGILQPLSKLILDDTVKAANDDGSSDGQILFRELVGQGVLVRTAHQQTGNVSFEGAGGFERTWDQCSSTPFLRSTYTDQVITYDDPLSLNLKATFIRQVGMLGANVFDVHGDTEQWDLTDAVIRGLDPA
ncbi:hypothetical protein AX17_000941 [Amanita inopinata Kibby_2008]|nr:hypothetical protein AX17_000941 [Amanita inopinata Kibby_2008]